MMIDITAAARSLLFKAAAGSDVDFATNDRFYTFVSRRLIKIDCAVENAMVGNRERRKLSSCAFSINRSTAGAVEPEHRCGDGDEQNRVRHAANLPGTARGKRRESNIFQSLPKCRATSCSPVRAAVA
jgi:hypothetical protein